MLFSLMSSHHNAYISFNFPDLHNFPKYTDNYFKIPADISNIFFCFIKIT